MKLEEHWQKDGSVLPLLTFPLLEQTRMVKHCFTTRMGGASKGMFESLNLSFTRGDDEAAVKENYRRLADALDVAPDGFVCSDQTHTTNIRKVTAEDRGKGVTRARDYTDIDGLMTDEPG